MKPKPRSSFQVLRVPLSGIATAHYVYLDLGKSAEFNKPPNLPIDGSFGFARALAAVATCCLRLLAVFPPEETVQYRSSLYHHQN
jgi:hypothetical protein